MERNYPNISVTDKAARSLRSGHPWVYADEVLRADAACTNGQIVYSPKYRRIYSLRQSFVKQ